MAAAKEVYERSIVLMEQQLAEDPTNPNRRLLLFYPMWRRGLTHRILGNPVGAAADVRRAQALCDGLSPRDGLDAWEFGCCHALLASLAGAAGSEVPAAEGKAEADKAMEWLGQAVDMGIRNVNELRLETALDPLRSRVDFKLLSDDLSFPFRPFAP